ncbi:MAG TPA: hypothetical protein VM100_03725 [Longimicrobiales bacterium]|nr:hypothetical protein [Longimicrobiales bacterium]
MVRFKDETGKEWTAVVAHETTSRHHGTWYMAFQDESGEQFPVPEFRWQTQATGERTLRTMSQFELRRRLNSAVSRRASA